LDQDFQWYWEELFWSAGHLPTFSDGAILVTNAGWKALAIGSGTTANYPDSLRLGSLTIDAPVDSHNSLLLNWAGLSVPLHPDSLTIGTNGSLISHSSAIEAGTFTVNGQATFADFGQLRFGSVQVGRSAPAELNLSNGWFSADELIVARGADRLSISRAGRIKSRVGSRSRRGDSTIYPAAILGGVHGSFFDESAIWETA